jgi:hypothetical protein
MPSTGFLLPTARTVDTGSGTWTLDSNILADDGAEATFALTVKNTAGRWLIGQSFGFDSAIPAGATIDQVNIRMEYRVNNTGGIANPELQAFVSGGAVGAVRAGSPAEPTTLTLNTFDITADRAWTRADLLNGTFDLRCRGRNGNSTNDPSYRWDYLAVEVVYTEPAVFTFAANSWRVRNDDGTQVDATWKAAQNTNAIVNVDEIFRVRFRGGDTGGASGTWTTPQLQYNLNSAGWNNVTGSSTVVRATDTAQFTDGTATTEQLTGGGGGTFVAGTCDDVDGAVASVSLGASGNTEIEFSVIVRSEDAASDDVVQLRVLDNGSPVTETNGHPSLSVFESAGEQRPPTQPVVTPSQAVHRAAGW